MLLYRITRREFADMSGTGARLYGGRWNSESKPVVYLASSRSLAVLEALAHLSPTNVPDDMCMMVVDAPEDIAQPDISALPANWEEFDDQYLLKQIGNTFLQKKEKLLFKVPSAIVTQEYNFLLNPNHPKAGQVKIISREPFVFDSRLTR